MSIVIDFLKRYQKFQDVQKMLKELLILLSREPKNLVILLKKIVLVIL